LVLLTNDQQQRCVDGVCEVTLIMTGKCFVDGWQCTKRHVSASEPVHGQHWSHRPVLYRGFAFRSET